MSWLFRHNWAWSLAAFLLGALITWLLLDRRTPAPAEAPAEEDLKEEALVGAPATQATTATATSASAPAPSTKRTRPEPTTPEPAQPKPEPANPQPAQAKATPAQPAPPTPDPEQVATAPAPEAEQVAAAPVAEAVVPAPEPAVVAPAPEPAILAEPEPAPVTPKAGPVAAPEPAAVVAEPSTRAEPKPFASASPAPEGVVPGEAEFSRLMDGGASSAPTLFDDEVPVGRFGPGSADAVPHQGPPDGFTIKGNAQSMLFHTPDSPYYGRTKAEVWFRTEADAERSGFTKYTRKPRKSTQPGN